LKNTIVLFFIHEKNIFQIINDDKKNNFYVASWSAYSIVCCVTHLHVLSFMQQEI